MGLNERVQRDKCPLCRLEASTNVGAEASEPGVSGNMRITTACTRCGTFSITWEALNELDRLQASTGISGITREWTELGRLQEINKDNLNSLISLAPKTFRERRRKLLQALARRFPMYGQRCDIYADKDYPLAYVSSKTELRFIIQHMQSTDYLKGDKGTDGMSYSTITDKGWEEVDVIEKPAALRQKAFVAMSFNEEVKPAYIEGIAPAIVGTGYHPIRLDLEEHSDIAIDRNFAEIKESRFAVADFTFIRGGVYFEAGFARGLGLNVIWTCKDDHLKDLHFDVKGFNTIVWKSPEDLRERLSARIRAIVGYGPLHNPTETR